MYNMSFPSPFLSFFPSIPSFLPSFGDNLGFRLSHTSITQWYYTIGPCHSSLFEDIHPLHDMTLKAKVLLCGGETEGEGKKGGRRGQTNNTTGLPCSQIQLKSRQLIKAAPFEYAHVPRLYCSCLLLLTHVSTDLFGTVCNRENNSNQKIHLSYPTLIVIGDISARGMSSESDPTAHFKATSREVERGNNGR